VVRVNREQRRARDAAARRRRAYRIPDDVWITAPALDLSGWKSFKDLDDIERVWDEAVARQDHEGECTVCRAFGIKDLGQDHS
jgi:hypothetical protein